MVKHKPKVCAPSKAKFKKCLITAIQHTKIASRKGAQKAFEAAAKKCSSLAPGSAPKKSAPKKKGMKRKTAKPVKKTKSRKKSAKRRAPLRRGLIHDDLDTYRRRRLSESELLNPFKGLRMRK